MRTLSKQTRAAVSKAVQTSIRAAKEGAVALDALIADGFDKPTDFISPKSEGSTIKAEEFKALNEAIVLGFAADIRKLLAKPVKSLSESQKTTRRYWQQQIGARRNDFKRQLAKRLEPDSDEAGSRNRTIDQRVRDDLNDALKVCQAAEEAPFDLTDMVKKIKAALALLK